ncbi:DEAD/DEAH box helicase [Candidatus Roizmanbacteria bacterium]|nr:DEAD/DEAH box helicase [Candidatus Roizmanbacteria bacterium]
MFYRPNSRPRYISNGFRRFGQRPRFSNNGRRQFKGQFIHESRFIKKAAESSLSLPTEPIHLFTDFEISDQLKKNIAQKGYIKPTPIQDQTITHILEGKDVLGIANTGTGKTAAFIVPLINKIQKNSNERVLIMVPTRELALQIRDEIKSFTVGLPIYSALCIGGAFVRNQIYELRRNPHFVVGTPGRLKDLVERKILNLSTFKNVVLDEVDRMLDMGFIRDITYLMSLLSTQRQTLFFSATVTHEVETLFQKLLNDPVKISVKTSETATNVEQDIIKVARGEEKFPTLRTLLQKTEFRKVLIFGRTKHGVEKLSIDLFKSGFKVGAIHGNKPQSKRQHVMRLFRENGRTGRADNKGKALTFVG